MRADCSGIRDRVIAVVAAAAVAVAFDSCSQATPLEVLLPHCWQLYWPGGAFQWQQWSPSECPDLRMPMGHVICLGCYSQSNSNSNGERLLLARF